MDNDVAESWHAELQPRDAPTEARLAPETGRHQGHSRTRLIAGAVLSVLLLVAGLTLFRSPVPDQSIVPVPTASQPAADAPVTDGVGPNASFASTVLDTRWTHYESATEGFSLELPPGWGPFATGDQYGPDLRFSASEAPPFGSFGAALFVMRSPTNGYSDPAEYFEIWRTYLATTADADGDVGMTTTQMRDGQGFVLTTEYNLRSGGHTETAYGVLHGDAAYRLVFVVSGQYLAEYEDTFHDIAMTFDLAS